VYILIYDGSGMLKSKTRELIRLLQEAQIQLAKTRQSFVEGMKIAKKVKVDLDYIHQKVRYNHQSFY